MRTTKQITWIVLLSALAANACRGEVRSLDALTPSATSLQASWEHDYAYLERLIADRGGYAGLLPAGTEAPNIANPQTHIWVTDRTPLDVLPQAQTEPVDYVDPLINSDNARIFQTKTASRPFGLVQLAPDTVVGKGFWGGYSYGTANIKGFGHVRDWRIAGMLVMPTTGGVTPAGPDSWNSDFSHDTEVAHAGYHKVILDRYGIAVELTSTMRVGMHRWTFENQGTADIMFDMMTFLKEAGPADCTIRKVSDTELEGWVQMASDGGGRKYKLFFVAQFDKAMEEFRAWKESDLGAVDEVSGFPVVGYPRFKVSAHDVVQMKCAISYCSIDQARSNMALELNHWDFDKVRDDSRTEWNNLLKKIEVAGGTLNQRRKFYTDLWHVLLGRSTCSDANGKYPDRTGGSLVIRELPKKNIASDAKITSSSEFNADFAARRTVDGIIGKTTGEWASRGETTPWIKLSWPSARTLNRIDLFDRPNATDDANSGRLVFSDSTSIDVTDIPTDGEGKVVAFDSKTVDWVRFEVTGGTGANVGLSEIKTRDANSAPEFRMFNSDSLWWSMWNLNVVWGMAYPEILQEWVQSSLQHYDDDPKHRIPWGTVAGDHSWIMSGAQRTPLIARVIQMDMKHLDLVKAYSALCEMHEGAPFKNPAGNFQWGEDYKTYGYVPLEAVSFCAGQTVEHAWCDWVLSQVAAKLGDKANHEYYLDRSKSWENIWNAETGYLMPRHRDGSWKEPFDPFEGGYQGFIEGNAWGHLWFNVHDVMGLCNRMGGTDQYCQRLEHGFEEDAPKNFLHIGGFVDYGNQPSCQLGHLFNYARKPWLTQYWVRQVNEKAYGDVGYNKGLGVGDEDQGQMCGVSALMSIGLFSIRGCCDKRPIYEITSPVFDTVTIHLDPAYHAGGEFVIRTANNSAENCYIQSAKLNGRPLNKCWIYHKDFADGGTLEIDLGANPNYDWGSAEADRPPSASAPSPRNRPVPDQD